MLMVGLITNRLDANKTKLREELKRRNSLFVADYTSDIYVSTRRSTLMMFEFELLALPMVAHVTTR